MVRQLDFIQGIEGSASPAPGTPSVSTDMVSKGYADGQYAAFSSWQASVADNTALKAIAAGSRFDGQIAYNRGTDTFWRFNSSSALADDGSTTLQPTVGSGRWIKTGGSSSGSGSTIVQTFDTSVAAGDVAGEAITSRDALCIEVHNGTGTNTYRMFRADSSKINRRSFVGFAKAAVTGTAGQYTYTASAAYVASNLIPITINGRTYSVTYASSSDATLQALATAIATDPDVTSATVTVIGGSQVGVDDRTITIVAKGYLSLNITSTAVTGGASQPTITIVNTVAPVGGSVSLHQVGPLDSFSGLTTGAQYYLNSSAGAITTTPTDAAPVYVGRAMSTTVLYVDKGGFITSNWGSTDVLIRSHGSSTQAAAQAVQDGESFNYSAWSSITSSAAGAALRMGGGNSSYNGFYHVLDGINSSTTVTALFQKFDKASWTTLTNRGTAAEVGSTCKHGSYLYGNMGRTVAGTDANVTGNADKWNTSAWSSGTVWSSARAYFGTFVESSLLRAVSGTNNGSTAVNTHETRTTADSISTGTVFPTTGKPVASMNSGAGAANGWCAQSGSGAATNTYQWASGSWSSAIAGSVGQQGDYMMGGYSVNRGLAFTNGGYNGTSQLNSTQQFDGTSVTTGIASSNSRAYATGTVL